MDLLENLLHTFFGDHFMTYIQFILTFWGFVQKIKNKKSAEFQNFINSKIRDSSLIARSFVSILLEPFMEWVTRMGMDMEWVSGGYGYFSFESFGAGWVMG